MKKICLFTLLVISGLIATAQSSTNPGFDQTVSAQLPINLSVLGGTARATADIHFEEAERNERFGDLDAAVAMYNKAASEFREDKKYSRYCESLIRLSNVHLTLSNYAEAEKIVLKQVLKTYSKIESRTGQMLAYQQLGKIYLSANKLPQSLWFYTQHGILAQQLQNKTAYIESILGIASVKIKKRDYQLATKDLNTAELLSKNANTAQYNQQIKANRALIAERTTKKG